MKITDVRAVQPETPDSPNDWRTQLGQIVVKVTTSDGLSGIGVGGGGLAGVHIIETVLRDLLLGRDSQDVENLHQLMVDHTIFYGRKGVTVMALSGVDLALWDLRGRRTGLPVAKLLNADVDLTRQIPTYVTVFDEQDTRDALDNGVHAIKLHVERFGFPPDVPALAQFVQQVRKIVGAETEIMMDAFGEWDVASTLAVADAVQPFNVAWIEEPVPPDRFDDYSHLMKVSPVPIAGGEHEYLKEGFEFLIQNKLHKILQPDINWCGGMTTLVQIYELASEANLQVCPHRGSEPYALHAIAALDPRPLAESGRTWFKCLTGAPEIESGKISLCNRPGFGIDFEF